jgi:hypothetical protein
MTRVGHTSGPKTSEPRHLWTTLVVHFVHCFVIFFGVVGLVSSRFFQQYQWYRHRSFGISLRSFFLSLFFLSPPNDLWGERREKKIKNYFTCAAHSGYCWHIFLYRWTRLVKIFSKILVVLLSEFQCISRMFLFLSCFLLYSLFLLNYMSFKFYNSKEFKNYIYSSRIT